MDIFCRLLLIVVLTVNVQVCESLTQCLTGCSCVADRNGRSLICMEESAFGAIPDNIPVDMIKIRIEKSHFTEVPKGALLTVPNLENLWLNFNDITLINSKALEGLRNLSELRLQGNRLRSVPWTAFEDTPALKILDLKHNQLDVLPEHALKYLPGLTYLDLSFNQLSVISREVFLNWPLYQRIQSTSGQETNHQGPNVVLALHDNPWLCDCRLAGFVEFAKSLGPPILLMNSYLTCSGPDVRAGKFFHETELERCLRPVVSTPFTNISMPLGANITLQCMARGRPKPAVWWTYGLKIIRGFRESQEWISADIIRTSLVIPALHPVDRGLYTCSALNFLGNSSVSIALEVLHSPSSSSSSSSDAKSPSSPNGPRPRSGLPVLGGGGEEDNVYIDIRIAKQTVRGISIEWYATLERPSETWFTVHLGRADGAPGAREAVHVGPGLNAYAVSDLLPATKYDICVTLQNRSPRPGQCLVFVTGSDVTEKEQREKLIHIVVIVLAMVLAVPAGMYACTTDAKLACPEGVAKAWRNRQQRAGDRGGSGRERESTFDSLQAASDEGLVNRESSEDRKVRRRSEDRGLKNKMADHCRLTAELY
ncbi:leucine-rich repeat, immunoglobulin-like domain and transmembrane domain-containing protein 2 [Gadus morhua]|uniref:leucine-rich repeat, immunoglobulin-like domain and transmembrane domain-containing protein 2 n=1 Tax=Gadus morhua TaxID=8049 RepID=UPI0011B6C413|nr:leucine-rich repeat, immunoglobulin-like domain and transmembrane domain-containing protein 2 [Gadus morhua]